MTQEDSCI